LEPSLRASKPTTTEGENVGRNNGLSPRQFHPNGKRNTELIVVSHKNRKLCHSFNGTGRNSRQFLE